ncbi:MAG: hypothetical protein ACYTKD_14970 [Planctomycetota bacterium]|jgi:hypothetical protein
MSINILKMEIVHLDGTPVPEELEGNEKQAIPTVDAYALNAAYYAQEADGGGVQVIVPELIDDAYNISIAPRGVLSSTAVDTLDVLLEGVYTSSSYSMVMTEDAADGRLYVADADHGFPAIPTIYLPLDPDAVAEGSQCQLTVTLDPGMAPSTRTATVVQTDPILISTHHVSASFSSSGVPGDSLVVRQIVRDGSAVTALCDAVLTYEPATGRYVSTDGLCTAAVVAYTEHGEFARDSLVLDVVASEHDLPQTRMWLVETGLDSCEWTSGPLITGNYWADTGQDYPDPQVYGFKVRLQDVTQTDSELDWFGVGFTDEGERIILALSKLYAQGNGVYESKVLYAVRNLEDLDQGVRDAMPEAEFIKGDGCVVESIMVFLGVATGVKLGDNWWDNRVVAKAIAKKKAASTSQIFRIHDAGGASLGVGWWDWWDVSSAADSAGYTDDWTNICAERKEIILSLLEMNQDDIFIFHGHASSSGLSGYDTAGLTDELPLAEVKGALQGQAPGFVFISGCKGFGSSTISSLSPLAQAFVDAGTKVFVGYDNSVWAEAAEEGTLAFWNTLLQPGKTVGEARTAGQEALEEKLETKWIYRNLFWRTDADGKVTCIVNLKVWPESMESKTLKQIVPPVKAD